jgi:hypothetical protein
VDYYGRPRYDPNDTRVEYIYGKATWDKRSNSVDWCSADQDFEFLLEYVGPTEWYYKSKKDRIPKEIFPAYDRLGRQIQVGDFVTYILNTGVPSIEFGQVTKIVNGVDETCSSWNKEEYCAHVYCRNIKLDADERVIEKRIKHHCDIVIVHDDLKNELMMRRLSLG